MKRVLARASSAIAIARSKGAFAAKLMLVSARDVQGKACSRVRVVGAPYGIEERVKLLWSRAPIVSVAVILHAFTTRRDCAEDAEDGAEDGDDDPNHGDGHGEVGNGEYQDDEAHQE